MLRHAKWLLPVLLVFLAGPPIRAAGEPPAVRIGLLQQAPRVPFSALRGGTVTPLSGRAQPLALPAGETWVAAPAANKVTLQRPDGTPGGDFAGGVLVTPGGGGTTLVNGVPGHWDRIVNREYRGTIEIRPDGSGLTVVNTLDIESYLRGVVPSEMPYSYPRAALQAQAVAARGQALQKAARHEAEGFGLCATPHCQVYGGVTSEHPTSDEAVSSTRGEVLLYDERLADTLYSSNCGGHTASNEDFWPGAPPVPYLRGVEDFAPEDKVPYTFPLSEGQAASYLKYAPRVNCNQPQFAKTSKIRWWSVVPRADLEKQVEEVVGDVGDLLDVRVTRRATSGMVTRLAIIGSKRLVTVTGGADTRHVLGGLDSPSFAVEAIRGTDGLAVAFTIWGAGWGHQIGMCQVGAAGLAEQGWDYRAILAKYYTGTAVERRY